MKPEQRLAELEQRQEATEEKRKLLLAEHLALRTAFIELAAIISASSTEQFDALKGRAMDRAMHSLTNQMMAGEFSQQESEEATAALEELFCDIDAARSEADQPAKLVS